MDMKKMRFFLLIYMQLLGHLLFSSELDCYLLPLEHPISDKLQQLFNDPSRIENLDYWLERGFIVENFDESFREWSILVLSHPQIPDYVFKKKFNISDPQIELQNYRARIEGASLIAKYIRLMHCKHLAVPQKWLYCLPSFEGSIDRSVLICEKFNLIPGGYWGGPNKELYASMNREVMQELVRALYDLCGCDAWPQNLPFMENGCIAFIDTEHVGLSYGDFFRLLPFINPVLTDEAMKIWDDLCQTRTPWFLCQPSKEVDLER